MPVGNYIISFTAEVHNTTAVFTFVNKTAKAFT